jgi:nicotinamide-nucleotide amidase
VIVLPGPPWELQAMWPAALADPAVQAALSGCEELRQATIRLWGTPESELAATLRVHEARLAGLEITTCLRDGELEVVTRYAPAAQGAYDYFESALCATYRETLVSRNGSTVDDLVADALLANGLTIATAESCTAGLLAARLTERPGSSEYVVGGVVTYSNEAKQDLLGVPGRLFETVGAVSAEVATAMAMGARRRFGANIGVGVTGIAGPGGGSADKPVGLVHLCVVADGRSAAREIRLPGSRADVRRRAVLVALHLVRQLLTS